MSETIPEWATAPASAGAVPDWAQASANTIPDWAPKPTAPVISHGSDPNLVSTIAGGKTGAMLRGGFTRADLPDKSDVQEEVARESRPAVALPKFTVNPSDSKTEAVAKSAANLALSLPEFAESPLGVASLATGTAIPRTVAGLFLADTAKNVVQGSKEAGANWDTMTPAQKAAAVTDLTGQTLLAATLAHGAGGKVADAIDTRVNPAGMLARELDRTSPDFAKPGMVPIAPLQPVQEPGVPDWARPSAQTAASSAGPVAVPNWAAETASPLPATASEVPTPTPSSGGTTIPTEETPAADDSAVLSAEPRPDIDTATRLIPVDVSDAQVKAMKIETERPPDILDTVGDHYPKGVQFNAEDHGEQVRSAGGRAAELMFLNKGEPADQVLQNLHAMGEARKLETPDDLAHAMGQAAQVRAASKGTVTAEARMVAETQARDQLFNQANKASRQGVESVPVEHLFVGDQFTVKGEPMRVTGFATDADSGQVSHVEMEGAYGRQHLPVGSLLHMDEGSLKDQNMVAQTPTAGGSADINSGMLGQMGMGGAKPGEFNESAGTATGIKVAAIDAQRAARGLEPLSKQASRSFSGDTWQKTLAEVDDNPDAPANLVAELKAGQDAGQARGLTDRDVAMLLYREADLSYQRAKLSRDMAQAEDDARQFPNRAEVLPGMKLERARIADELDALENVIGPARSETGRGLAALRNMVGDNYTLQAMEFSRKAAKGGEPLTAAEHAELVKLRKQIDDSNAALEKAREAEAETRSKRMADDAIAQRIEDVKKAPGYDRQVQSIADRIVSALEREAVAARARLREKFARTSAGVDPTILGDLSIVGAAHVARGLLDFTRWSKAMVDEFGEDVVPWLNKAWEKSNAAVNTAVDRLAKGKQSIAVKQKVRKEDVTGQRAKIVDGLRAAKADQRPLDEQGDYIRKLMENFIASGLKEREPLVDAVHRTLTDDAGMKDVSRRDVREAMSNYGRFKALNPDEIKAKRRDISHQIAQTLKLEDIQAKRPLPKSGVEQHVPSTEGRLLEQQVNEAKRRYGVVTNDPARQLKSALDARKTWLKNQIADLEFQLKAGARSVKTKTATVFDAESKNLELRRDELVKELDEMAPKPGITDAQRAQAAERALDRNIYYLEQQIKSGEVSLQARRPQITSARLDALRTRQTALRAQRNELRAINGEFQRQQHEASLTQQKARLEKAIADKQLQLAAGPQPQLGREMNRPADPRLEPLTQARDQLNRQLAEMRKTARTPEETALKAYLARLATSTANYADRLARGDFAPIARREHAWQTAPEVIKARAANEAAKLAFQRANTRARLAQRNTFERAMDGISKWKRTFVLSWPTVLLKLTSAATQGMAYAPMEEAAGSLTGRMFPGIASLAPRHGSGLNVRAEVSAISNTVTHFVTDFKSALKTGNTELDLVHGKPTLLPREFKDFVGNFHYALKTPLMRNEFARSYSKLMQAEAKQGADVTEPLIQQRIGNQAYELAKKAIFKENNLVTKMYNSALAATRREVDGKQTRTGKIVETSLRWTFPVVDIPTTIVKRTFEYMLGAPLGLGRAALAYHAGIENLKPDEAEAIMRNLKRGSLGAAVLTIGFMNPDMFGGLYVPGDKGKPSDIPTGAARVHGHIISHLFFDTPLAQQLQIGATIRRIADEEMSKHNPQKKGIPAGAWAALLGLVGETPFMETAKTLVERPTPTKLVGNQLKSVIPGALQFTAQELDRIHNGDDVRRDPKTVLQTIETGIPSLRETVPAKK